MGLEQAKALWRKWFGKAGLHKEHRDPNTQPNLSHTTALWSTSDTVDLNVSPDEALRRFKNTQERRQTALRRLSCPVPPFFSPEHEVTVKRRYLLDQTVPKAIRQSQTSTDLQVLSLSDEAGKLPYCEDVARRNLEKSTSESKEFLRLNVKGSSGHYPDVSTSGSDELKRTTGVLRHGPRRHTVHIDQPRARFDQSRQSLTHAGVNDTPDVYLPPLRTDGRRRSLSHKANVVDLRVASQCSSDFRGSKWAPMSDDGRCSTSWSVFPCLDKPLPPIPAELPYAIPPARLMDCSPLHNNRATSNATVTQDTTLYEQWLPAVTHHTIQQDIHEVREENTEREIHKYHIYRRIQPVIEYEILPPRHFVHIDGGGYAEVSEDDLPPTLPRREWFTGQLAAQLEESPLQLDGIREFEGLGRDGVPLRSDWFRRAEHVSVEEPIYEDARWEEGPLETPSFWCTSAARYVMPRGS